MILIKKTDAHPSLRGGQSPKRVYSVPVVAKTTTHHEGSGQFAMFKIVSDAKKRWSVSVDWTSICHRFLSSLSVNRYLFEALYHHSSPIPTNIVEV
ncbi:hypothetical protein TNCV_5120351 [Trichonephila clavipes]|nr:hypothetical protein TNCV_5120351 [Trichonephila clavipes]